MSYVVGTSIVFEPLVKGGSETVVVTLKNKGTAPLDLDPVQIEGDGLRIVSAPSQEILQPGESTTMVIGFVNQFPNTEQTFEATCGLDGFGNQKYGTPVSVTVAAGTYRGDTLAAANALALAAATAQAQAALVCHWENAAQTANCSVGFVGSPVTIAAHTHAYDSSVSQAAANAAALAAATSALSCVPDVFSPPTIDGEIFDFAFESSGSVIIVGGFTVVGGVSHQRIARLSALGVLDATFAPSVDGTVNSVLILADGRIMIGGTFANVNSTARRFLAVLSAAGVLDSFNASLNARVGIGYGKAIAVDVNGKIVVCGLFTSAFGASHTGAMRLNSTLTIDATFAPSFTANNGAEIIALSDGKYVALGFQSQVVGGFNSLAKKLTTLGANDATFAPPLNNVGPTGIALQSTGKFIIVAASGISTTTDFVDHGNIVRASSAGAYDATFTASVTGGTSNSIFDITIDGSDSSYICGNFTTINAGARNRVAKLTASGSLDTFNPNANNNVNRILLNGGYVWAAGNFTTIVGTARSRIARINLDGTLA